MGNSETALKTNNIELDKSKEQVHEDWNVCPGKLDDNSVTVFSAIHPPSSRKRMFMEKALQGSKIYRHPSILRFMDGGIVEKEVVVVTECGTPLLLHGLDQMSPLQITAGLSSIIEALVFLHDKAGVSHNNVCASSIYITSDGSWKLWGLEYLCSFGELTRDYIEKINQYCSQRNLPSDDKNRISPAYQHSRDCFFLAKFIQEYISPLITVDSDIPLFDEFLIFIKTKALHDNWSERPRMSTFLTQPLFNHEFIKLRQSLNNVLLLPASERDNFIKSLPAILLKYSEEAVAITYGPVILSRSFMLIPSSVTYLMPSLLTPKNVDKDIGIFSTTVYKNIIVPILLNLFQVHDATIRKVILTYFHHYVSLISKTVLTSHILPQILLGIRDTDEALVSSTLRCLACLVTVLGADTVIGKNRQQIFITSKPKLESNMKIVDLKRKGTKIESKSVVPHFDNSSSIQLNNKDEVAPSQNEITFVDIPERSSPDGGEVSEDDIYVGKISPEGEKYITDENWSDWEDVIDKPPRESKSSDNTIEASAKCFAEDSHSISAEIPSTMSSKAAKEVLRPVLQGLGEEYDIKSLKVDKRNDSELDLFADLQPKLCPINFDLETMLIEASHQCSNKDSQKVFRDKLPSLSDTLAELQIESFAKEGAAWDIVDDQISLPSGDESSSSKSCYVSNEISQTNSPIKEMSEKV